MAPDAFVPPELTAADKRAHRGHDVAGIGRRVDIAQDPGSRLGVHVGDVQVDVAVVVDVAGRHPHGAEVSRAAREGVFPKGAVTLVKQQDTVPELVGHVQVRPAVVVGVEPNRAEGGTVAARGAAGGSDLFELPVPLVAEEQVATLAAALAVEPGTGPGGTKAGHVQVEPAVAVVVGDGKARDGARQAEVAQVGDVPEALAGLVAEDLLVEDEVLPAVAVEIDKRRGQVGAVGVQQAPG